jgi:hypothetical protein
MLVVEGCGALEGLAVAFDLLSQEKAIVSG